MAPSDSTSHSVSQWLQELREGDSFAARELFNRYYPKLTRLAEKKLPRSRRRAVGEEDMAADAFYHLVRAIQAGRLPWLRDRKHLWHALVRIVERRATDRVRRETAIKRGGGAVRGESALDGASPPNSLAPGFDRLADSSPTPARAAELAETAVEMLQKLDENDPRLRPVALAKLEGCTNAEIATLLDVPVRTVERRLQFIRRIWAERCPS